MASASARVGVAPLDEKVAIVERQVQNTQYALKFVGAAFSSMYIDWLLDGTYSRLNRRYFADMASSATVNPTDMWVQTRRDHAYAYC